ncbi:uncharacterized protein LY89DRAFT_776028 [Mollisia scopiformis]|uniref:Uncharacterized protein n=1 Tax=Mollisia scopiformis TaxID=149040 RepID=A0A194XU97_MOLSC|nr:uncharacterized protein LY89DRAFT_776028 [Mollisia scopiformis]KUJ23783.1 hypothetical protein LY89DRAFT_776028 [Mollisia scopiformis]
MQFLRRFGTPLVTISLLIGLSVLTVVSVGEGLKLFVVRRDEFKLRRRDGSTITLNMPWNPPKIKTDVKAINPAVGGMLNAVEAVASALLGDGTDMAANAQAQASIVTATIIPIAQSVASTALGGGTAQVPAAVADVTSAINQATGVVGGIVSAANSIVASMVAGAVSASNIGILSTSVPLSATKSASGGLSSPFSTNSSQHGLCSTCNSSPSSTALPLNITSAPLLSSMTSQSVLPMAPSCTSMPSCTSCPAAYTETCTVTETWHSTHYAETATLYSFVAAFTVTCTETVSVCPSLSAYLPPANAILPTQPPLIACANGALAKRQEDCTSIQTSVSPTSASPSSSYLADSQTSSHPCPNAGYSCSECPGGWFCPPSQTAPQSAPCGFGWACGACSGGWFCIPNPTASGGAGAVNSVAGLLSSVSVSLTQDVPSTMASFTAQPPSFLSTLPTALATTTGPGTVTCIDGSVVQRPQDCLNGISEATSSLGAFVTSLSPTLSQATNLAGSAVGGAETALNPALANVNSALAQVSGLSGGLLSTIMANLASALGAANTLGSNAQPTAASLVGNAGILLSSVNTLEGNDISQATALANTLAGNVIATGVSVVGNGANNAASAINVLAGNAIPTATAAIGNVVGNLPGLIRDVKEGGNTIGHITTILNGQSTILPIVVTILNGEPTVVPVVNMVVNGASTNLPVLNGASGQSARLVGRARPKQNKLETASYEVWLEEGDGNLA